MFVPRHKKYSIMSVCVCVCCVAKNVFNQPFDSVR